MQIFDKIIKINDSDMLTVNQLYNKRSCETLKLDYLGVSVALLFQD